MINSIESFRAKLQAKELCLGTGITFNDPAVIEALAPSLDFFWIDMEHNPMGMETLLDHLIAARATSTASLVRVPGTDPQLAKRVLDSGAEGIIFPQVRSAEDVRRMVRCCRYAPLGNRGWGPRRPSEYGRRSQEQVVREGNESLFVVAQIENAQAVAELDEIVAIQGLDSLAIGPYDLSADLGFLGQLDHPSVLESIKLIINKAHEVGLPIGVGDEAAAESSIRWAKMGIDWIQCGCDFSYLIQTADDLIKKLRGAIRQ